MMQTVNIDYFNERPGDSTMYIVTKHTAKLVG